MTPWLSVIGIGGDGLAGLPGAARALVETAEVVVGGARHLAMVPPGRAERLEWRQPLTETVPEIAARRGRRVVVLASGDPMWYGVGVMLARAFPHAEIAIVPHPGAFSFAAARLGWGLADCAAISLHSRPLDTLRLQLSPGRRILALSEDGTTPGRVARLLTETGWGPTRMTVLEHLGSEKEAVVESAAQKWGEPAVADLNTIALDCRPGSAARPLPRLAGLPDDAFEHDGQLTKREIRGATLAALAPLDGETLWDIGAGSGSIAIEWLRAIERGAAVAVERDPGRAAAIARNAAALGVPGLEIIVGEAPSVLPQDVPDAVFVGGGVADPTLLQALWEALRPGGRLVATAVSLDGEQALIAWQERYGGALSRIAVSRAEPLGSHRVWRPLLPVTQLVAAKPT